MKLIIIFGTRPEVIKLAPVIRLLRETDLTIRLLHTLQHRELAGQMLSVFRLEPDLVLNAEWNHAEPHGLRTEILPRIAEVLKSEQPDAVLVQGDTHSAYYGARAASHSKIPVWHLEAGLRSHDPGNPFPEEMYRREIAKMAALHFAPAEWSKSNLLAEGISPRQVFVTGNTVIDALHFITNSEAYRALPATRSSYEELLLLTVHRRENHGDPLRKILQGIIGLLGLRPQLRVVFPAHPNPEIQSVLKTDAYRHDRLEITRPYGYLKFLKTLNDADLILTDSGGVQEEAAALGKKLLVLRTKTERQELIENGYTMLVGCDPELIVRESLARLNTTQDPEPVSVYGTGKAAEKVVRIILDQL